HRSLDAVHESKLADKVGSTLKGIGPTYQDKIGRFGLRVGDALMPDFMDRYTKRKNRHISILKGASHSGEIDDAAWLDAIEFLKTLKFADTAYFLNEALQRDESILADSAQGSLLDVD